MLSLITSIFSIVGPLITSILQNRGVIGANTQNLINGLAGPLANLTLTLQSGATKTSDALAVLAAASGVIAVLKSTTGLPAETLTQINALDADIAAALTAYAKAGAGFDASLYTITAEV